MSLRGALYALLLLGSLAVHQPAIALKPKCEAIAAGEKSKALQMARGLLGKLPWELWKFQRLEVRASDSASAGRFLTVNTATFTTEVEEGLHFSSATYFSSKKVLPSQITSALPDRSLVDWALAQFNGAMNRAVNLVIPTYEVRRLNWPDSFTKKLKPLAEKYKFQSTYINIENKPWPDAHYTNVEAWAAPPEAIASLRLITELNGKIPMEEFLGLEILTENKIKAEPGNFTIAREANEVAWVQIAIQLISQIRRLARDYGKEPLFPTIADEFSEELYKKLGFSYFKPEQLKFDLEYLKANNWELTVDAEGHMRVVMDGRIPGKKLTWAPMYATEESLTQAMYAKLDQIAKKQSDQTLIIRLRKAVKSTATSLFRADETLGFERASVRWEVPGEIPIGGKCPSQAKQYDDIAYRDSGNRGYLCFACDFSPENKALLVVTHQSRCPREISCFAGICI